MKPATQKIRIGDCLSYVVDNRGKTPPLSDAGYELIEVNAIGGTERSVDYGVIRKYVSEETYQNWFRKGHPEIGDTLISTVGAIGRVAFFMRQRGCIAQNVIAMRPNRNVVDPEFFYYLLKSPAVQDRIQSLNIGVAQPSLKVPHLLDYEIEILARERQGEASRILSAYDDLIENNTRRIEILEEMARRLYEEWFVHFRFPGHEEVSFKESELGRIPENWEVATLESVCDRITDGAHKSPPKAEVGKPMASVKDMHNWGIDLSKCRRISEEDYADLVRNNCKPLPGDVLIAKDGSYLKHSFVMEKEVDLVLLSSIAILRPNNEIAPNLLALTLQHPDNVVRMKGFVSGVAIPRIILKDFRKFKIILPPAHIQKSWSLIADPMMTLCRRLVDKNANLRAQRDLLLPKLVSGEIDVSDIPMPDDKEVEAA